MLFVLAVVAARAVGGAHAQVEFLFEHQAPVELDRRRADERDASLASAELGGEVERLGGVGCGGDEGEVHAVARGGGIDPGRRDVARARGPFGALVEALAHALFVEIDPKHPAAVGLEQLYGELADQAQADHGGGLAEGRVCHADPL